MWKLLALALVACRGAEGPCGDAVDEGFARKHAERQTLARLHPDIRDELEAEQLTDDQLNPHRRRLYVAHCIDDDWNDDERACVATGDLSRCLSNQDRAAIERDHVELSRGEIASVFGRYADRMCHCHDKACAERITLAMTKLGDAMAKTADRDLEPDEASAKRLAAIMTRYGDCMAKAMAAEPPLQGRGDAN